MNILLTGTRAPATLDLARRLWRQGHTVVGADSLRFPLGRYSKAFAKHYHVPRPRQEPDTYVEALLKLVERHRIDLLWPTCEEIFHIATAHEKLSPHVKLLCDPIAQLEPLHHKLEFAQLVEQMSGADAEVMVTAPPSWPAAEAPTGHDLVWKPYYSRFAARTRFDAPPSTLDGWMAQARVRGREFSSWALCVKGAVRVQTFYECPVRAGRGAGCAFIPYKSDQAAHFVVELAQRLSFTGSLAFDFIEEGDGKAGQHPRVFVIECNPRLTSGVHLLDPEFPLADLLTEGPTQIYIPSLRAAQLRLPVLFCRPSYAGKSPDVIGCADDPGVLRGQAWGVAELAWLALRKRISLLAATTWDIEYNGSACASK